MGKVIQARLQQRPPESGGRKLPDARILRFQAADGTYFLAESALQVARTEGVPLEIIRGIDEGDIPVRFLPPERGLTFEPAPEEARMAVLARLLAEDRARGEEDVRFLGRNRAVPADGFELDRVGGGRRYVWQVVPRPTQAVPGIVERLPRLRELLTNPRVRVALSLGSGGLKLFAHATLLRLLEDLEVDEHLDEIWGSSAGALAALLYSHGLSPAAIEQTGFDLYAGRWDLSIHPSKIQVLRQLLREALVPARESSHAGFVDCSESLARMLDRYCATLRPRRSLFCIAFNLADCRPAVLSPEAVPKHLEELITQTEARDAALASAAVPLLFVPRVVRVGDRDVPFIDGSTTEEVPLYSVVRKWDLDREAGVERRESLVILYVKLTGSPEIYRTPHGRVGKLRLLQTIASAGMDTMHQRDLALISARPDVSLLPVHLPGPSPDFFEIGRIPEWIRLAREAFPEQLLDLEQSL